MQRLSRKGNSPSPDRYNLSMEWPKTDKKAKTIISEKSNFVDTCQYYSDKTPGPGSYKIALMLAKDKKEGKSAPHHPLQPR